ncbi:alkaline phosphatase family protein [uncultured Desulfosarcina sp.]|uniref:alkaline phosphatase family protein n=1 Tax=uncultured Desulfosarcina sp. TaxID=218289 RepID=UPI0029C7B438|nr:alkaline phosphatase family protein [uncultured Desulfosarcina sp.]
MAKKCILILLDGLGDRSFEELDDLTPLQAARTPALDQLARKGANGLYHAASLGQALPSENAHFSLFGYDLDAFPGRGALEALGAGIPLAPGTVAILAHFVSVTESPEGTLLLVDGKPDLPDDELKPLFQAVEQFTNESTRIRLHPTHGFRGILTLDGHVAPFVTDSDPFKKGRPLTAIQTWQAFADDPASVNTESALKAYLKWAYHTLSDHPRNRKRREKGRLPLNALVTQRAGQLKAISAFEHAYGLRGLSISSGLIYHGLAAYLKMDVRKATDSDDPGHDLAERLEMAMASLADYDFIHVHTKMPDVAGHTKNPLFKKQVIEALDEGIQKVLERLISDPELLVVVTADHSTPSGGPLIHSGEAVPLIFCGPGVRRDAVGNYDEISAAGGALGQVRGKELMYLIVNHLDRAKLHGLMDTPIDQPYWPGRAQPFRLREPEKTKDGI